MSTKDREFNLNIHEHGFDVIVSESDRLLGIVHASALGAEIIYPDSGPQYTFEYRVQVKRRGSSIPQNLTTVYSGSRLEALGEVFDIAEQLR